MVGVPFQRENPFHNWRSRLRYGSGRVKLVRERHKVAWPPVAVEVAMIPR